MKISYKLKISFKVAPNIIGLPVFGILSQLPQNVKMTAFGIVMATTVDVICISYLILFSLFSQGFTKHSLSASSG